MKSNWVHKVLPDPVHPSNDNTPPILSDWRIKMPFCNDIETKNQHQIIKKKKTLNNVIPKC